MKLKDEKVDIYQLHIYLKYSSPLVWRRLLVRVDTTIADLHHYIQIVMGWEDEHLHQFTIRKGSYGISYEGGIEFGQNPKKILLGDFDFYMNEKFKYEYNFHVPWEHEIRIEKRLPLELKKKYPLCMGGKNVGPPETCYSMEEFIEFIRSNSPARILIEMGKTLKAHVDGKFNKEEVREILRDLMDAYDKLEFNKKAINNKLQEYMNSKSR
jgi:hypothetical protein